MEPTENPFALWVIVVGIVQTVYYTALIIAVAARISSRIAVMEFKVEELWQIMRSPSEEG